MAEEEYQFDPWETSSGLPDFLQVRIENPHFGYDANIENGTRCLFIPEGTVLSGDGIDEPTEFSQFYGCGPGYEPAGKGGTRCVREDGKPRMFNDNVAYAHLFTSLKKAAETQGLLDQLRKKGTPFDAALWQGMVLDLKRVKLPSFEGRDGKMVERSILEVSQIVKLGDSGSGSDDVQTSASVKSGPEPTEATPTPAASNGAGELDAKTKAKIKAMAREVREAGGTHAQFVEKAFDIDGVLDNAVAEAAVLDETPEGIWESVGA